MDSSVMFNLGGGPIVLNPYTLNGHTLQAVMVIWWLYRRTGKPRKVFATVDLTKKQAWEYTFMALTLRLMLFMFVF
jgi:hypothetical protein